MATEDEDRLSTRLTARIALLFALGIIVPGVASHYLHAGGYPLFGKFVWVLGFGTVVLTIWSLWLRPLDLKGPN